MQASNDRLTFFLFICTIFAMTRVVMVLFYLPDEPPSDMDDIGELRFMEMDYHKMVLRSLEEQRQAKVAEDAEKAALEEPVKAERKDPIKEARKELENKLMVEVKRRAQNQQEDTKDDDGKFEVETLQKIINERGGKWFHGELKFPILPSDDTLCPDQGKDIFLFTIILSYPKNAKERQAIRDTYGGLEIVNKKELRTLFFVGSPPTEPLKSEMATKLAAENEEYGDILQTSVHESVKKTTPPTTRIMAAFKYVITNCPLAKFTMIGNDELFINYENIVRILEKADGNKGAYIGRSKKNERPQRDNKRDWNYVPESQYKGEFYPQFCIGGAGFIVSKRFLHKCYETVLESPEKAKKFPLGDVYLGIVSQQLRVLPRYNDNFRKQGGEATYCDLRDSVTMGDFNTPEKMIGAWRNLSIPVEKCPPYFPAEEDIVEWSKAVDNSDYFDTVLDLKANPKTACERNAVTNAPPYLLALVSSQPEHFDLRDAIRQTWGAPRYMSPLNARTLFVLGKSKNQTQAMTDRIMREARDKRDIILADFNESFHNLTLKVVLGLRWTSYYCDHIKYIYKGDDDMLVNFGRIIKHLENIPPHQAEYYFLGHLMQRSPVVRTGQKYFVSRETYPFKYWLPYFSGGGYIFSIAAARKMYESSVHTKLIPIDDAYAGILAFRTNITLRGSNDFITTGSRKDACRLRTAFNLHGFKRTDIMISTWEQFLDTTNDC